MARTIETAVEYTDLYKHAPSRRFDCVATVSLAAPLMSIYTLPGAATALERLGIPDDHYIINVTYGLAEDKLNCTGDTQLFVTGTVAKREEPISACVRELHEEVMVQPTGPLQHIHHISETKKRRTREIDWYACKITDLEPSPSVAASCGVGDGRNKVGCMLHGTYEEVLELFRRVRIADVSSDGIVGVIGLRVGDVRKILGRISSYKSRDHFFWCHNWAAGDVFAFSGGKVPAGAASAIHAFAETMGTLDYYHISTCARGTAKGQVPGASPPYCDDLECVGPAEPGSKYCSNHKEGA